MTPAPAASATFVPCEACGRPVPPGGSICPSCGARVSADRVTRLAADARRLEAVDPLLAARAWRQCLAVLPPDSPDARAVAARADVLSGQAFAPRGAGASGGLPGPRGGTGAATAGGARPETWVSVLFKTGGSMALSVALFAAMGGWELAVGLVLLIFVHEMGHVVANWRYGIRQSPPIFLGIFGAVIFLKGGLRNAREEAVSGIAGPVFGSVAALACYAYFLRTGHELAGLLAFYGLFLNAWNLMPVPPLDGGRAAAAISPWLWAAGLVGLVGFAGYEAYRSILGGRGFGLFGLMIVLWILGDAVPRVRHTLLGGGWRSDYYRVGWRVRVGISGVYVGLLVVLVGCMARLRELIG